MRQAFHDAYPQLVVRAEAARINELMADEEEDEPPGRPSWHELVEVDEDGDVLAGDLSVARAIVEGWLAEDPHAYLAVLDHWLQAGECALEDERDWRHGWERQLAAHPAIALALERSTDTVLQRAGLVRGQREAYHRALAGDGQREIARALHISASTVRAWLDDGALRLQALALTRPSVVAS